MKEETMTDAPAKYDCEMTLAFPAAIEEELVDFLLEHPKQVHGFSLIAAQGMGHGAGLKSAMEKVRGRAQRRLISILLRNEDITPLLEALRKAFPNPDIAYWIVPLLAFGRMG